MIALVLAGGSVHAGARLHERMAGADMIVAADGGLRHAEALGLTPDLLVGDLDSVRAADLDLWPDLPQERFPADKDAMDLELAIDAAWARGAHEVRVVGGFGGRLDQTVAAALVALRYATRGLRVALLDGRHDAHPLGPGDLFDEALPDRTVFSLLAIAAPATLDVSGAAYELTRGELPPGVGLGLSNEARGGPRVRVHDGQVLLIVEWHE